MTRSASRSPPPTATSPRSSWPTAGAFRASSSSRSGSRTPSCAHCANGRATRQLILTRLGSCVLCSSGLAHSRLSGYLTCLNGGAPRVLRSPVGPKGRPGAMS
jgi:hypothetical protein